MKSLRAYLAAAAIALIGIAGAGTASAKPVLVGPGILKLCRPHVETKVQYVGIVKIGFKFYKKYKITKIFVNRLCHKKVIFVGYKYIPLHLFPHLRAPGV